MQKLARSLGRTEMVYRKNGLIGTLAVKRRIARKLISQVSPQGLNLGLYKLEVNINEQQVHCQDEGGHLEGCGQAPVSL